MPNRILSSLLVVAAALSLTACNRELKPSKLGVFVVNNAKIADWQATVVDEEITGEGFILPYFTGEVTTLVRYPATYMILNGEYRPLGLRSFVWRNGRFEEDGSSGLMTDAIQTQQYKGEKQMYKVRLTKDLKPGVYILEVKQTEGRILRFAFKVP